jgi:hypothetical protein
LALKTRRPAGKREFDIAPGVDARAAFLGMRAHDRRMAEPPHDVQAVAAQVHQGAPTQLKRPPRVAGLRRGHGHPHLDVDEVADRAVTGQFERAAGHRMKQVVKALHHGDSRGVRGLGDPFRLRAIAGERLLRQNWLARPDGRQIPRRVQRVRQWVVDDVDLGIVDHVVVRRQSTFHAVLLGEDLSPSSVACGDRHQPMPQFVGGPDDGQLCDAGCAEHPDP